MLGDVIRDFNYAIRSFARRPLFTAVIVLTLALGIGSNVAMFSVANTVLLRALPYDHPEELALVWTRLQATNVERSLVSGPDLGDYQAQTTRFEGFAGAAAVPGTLTGDGQAERIVNGSTTWNLFELSASGRSSVGPSEATTRSIDPRFATPIRPATGQGDVGYELWQRRFGDRDVIAARSDGWLGLVVVGVLPPTFGSTCQRTRRCRLTSMPGACCRATSPTSRGRAWLRWSRGCVTASRWNRRSMRWTRLRRGSAGPPFHKTQNLQIRVNGLHRDVVTTRPALLALLAPSGSCC
jgi:hypothetical protein